MGVTDYNWDTQRLSLLHSFIVPAVTYVTSDTYVAFGTYFTHIIMTDQHRAEGTYI